LENRYTDWGNYYPALTLRNLWDICSFVPAQKLQIEFLNIDRNAEKYKEDDVLAPSKYSYEYALSTVMFANPLCWFEPSALKTEALERYGCMINLHRKYRNEIFAGYIFPIGQRPDGYSWTGFQSHNLSKNSGFIIIYRELNENTRFSIKPLFMEERSVHLQSLSDKTSDITIERYNGDGIEIQLDNVNSFRLYFYQL
ncbi:MAG TPA: hypothetical protein PK733_14245, partial [Clostridiales bacterium]|nr:hypothetical protein [Clostridiales bacterium]